MTMPKRQLVDVAETRGGAPKRRHPIRNPPLDTLKTNSDVTTPSACKGHRDDSTNA